MQVNLFVAYLYYLNPTNVFLLELFSQRPHNEPKCCNTLMTKVTNFW